MFKFITLSCLLAASAHCKTPQNTALPIYPQPYPTAHPSQAYPQFYVAQPKYNAQSAYVAAAPYRQVLVPASPAYNPYYYGYAPYPAYPQQYAAYPYVQNDGAQAPAGAQPGWGEYLSSIWNYVPSYPFGGSSESQASGAESASSASTAESSATAAEASPEKGDKPTEGQKAEQPSASNEQSTAPLPSKPSTPAAFDYVGQPQYFGQYPYQPAAAAYDPAKLNTASNGAVSNFWFYRNQLQPVFQAPQPFADQKYYQNPALFDHGTAALAYQRYLQYQKQQQGQFQNQQDQQEQQPQSQEQQQRYRQVFQQIPQQQQEKQQQSQEQQQRYRQVFQQIPQQPFEQQQQYDQQYEQKSQQDESSVVVDSNVTGGQQAENQPQSKLATGSN